MKNTLEQLIKKEEQARKKRQNFEEKEYKKNQIPFLKSLVGKCFIYPENSCGDDETWPVFKKVIGYRTDKNGLFLLKTEEFQIMSTGRAELIYDEHLPYNTKIWWNKIPFVGYEYLSNKKYNVEKKKFFDRFIGS